MPTLDDLMAVIPRPAGPEILVEPPAGGGDPTARIEAAVTRANAENRPLKFHGDFTLRKPILLPHSGTILAGSGTTTCTFRQHRSMPVTVVYRPDMLAAIGAPYNVPALYDADGMAFGPTTPRYLDLADAQEIHEYWSGPIDLSFVCKWDGTAGGTFASAGCGVYAADGLAANLWSAAITAGGRWQVTAATGEQAQSAAMTPGTAHAVTISIRADSVGVTLDGTPVTVACTVPARRPLDSLIVGGIGRQFGFGWKVGAQPAAPVKIKNLVATFGGILLSVPLTAGHWYGPCWMYSTQFQSGSYGTLRTDDYFVNAGGQEVQIGVFNVVGGVDSRAAGCGVVLYNARNAKVYDLTLRGLVDGIRYEAYSYAVRTDNLTIAARRYGLLGGLQWGLSPIIGGEISGCRVGIASNFDGTGGYITGYRLFGCERPVVVSTDSSTGINLHQCSLFNENEPSAYPVVTLHGAYRATFDQCLIGRKMDAGPLVKIVGGGGGHTFTGCLFQSENPGGSDVLIHQSGSPTKPSMVIGGDRYAVYNGSPVPWTNEPGLLTVVGAT